MGKKKLPQFACFFLLIMMCVWSTHEVLYKIMPNLNTIFMPGAMQDVKEHGPSDATVTFAVLGDSRVLAGSPDGRGSTVLRELIDKINQDGVDLTLYTGDGPEQGGPIENMLFFREALNRLASPWYPVIGNREIYQGASPDGTMGDGENNFHRVFHDKLPARKGKRISYYSFNHKGSHFIVLNTAWQHRNEYAKNGLYPGGAQWKWLVRDLHSARQKSKHIFIFGHEPPLVPPVFKRSEPSSGLLEGYSTTWIDPQVARSFVQLCREYRVDAVFSGHLHAFLQFKDGVTTHIITGGAGADLHVPPLLGGYYHYVLCSVSGDSVKYEVVPLKRQGL